MKNAEALLLLGALSVFLPHLYYGLPVTSDAYENFRILNYLENGGGFPVESTAINGEAAFYPPVFSLSLLEFRLLTGFSPQFSLHFFSYIFAFVILLGAYLVLRQITSDEIKAILGAAAALSIPMLYYRLVTPIPETLGAAFFLLSALAYSRKDGRLLFFLLSAFPFVHSRSFVFTIATLGIMSAVFDRKRIPGLMKNAALGIIIFLFTSPKNAAGFGNPFVTAPSAMEVLPPLSIALILLGFAAFWLKWEEARGRMMDGGMRWAFSVSAAFAALFFLLPFPFRHGIFLALPVGILASEGLSMDARLARAFFLLLPLAMLQAVALRSAPFDLQAIEAMKRAGEYGGADVIADFKYNYGLPYFGNKKVILGAFAEALPDGNQRAADLAAFFGGGGAEKGRVLNAYKIGIGFFEGGKAGEGFAEGAAEGKMLESDRYAVYSFGDHGE